MDALNLVIKPNSFCEECRNKTLKKVKNQYMLHGFKPSGMHKQIDLRLGLLNLPGLLSLQISGHKES